jgi:hypothetical protein
MSFPPTGLPRSALIFLIMMFFVSLLLGCSGAGSSGCGQIAYDPIPVSIQRQVAGMRRRAVVGAPLPLTSLPEKHSLPGAPATLYLKFDGETSTTLAGWPNDIVTPAYDLDGDATTFSDAELVAINDIWLRVSEMFAPFNIDVATVPGAAATTLKIFVGGSGGWYTTWSGHAAAGVAYIGAYRSGFLAKVGFVFSAALGGNTSYVADAVAHEAGHGFGLSHQGDYDSSGAMTATYGVGNGTTPPIMGYFYSGRSVWYNGFSGPGKTPQNDMTILGGVANGFGLRTDQHANTYVAESALADTNGVITGSGVIEQPTDVDILPFHAGSGDADLKVSIAPTRNRLDLAVELHDDTGATLASAAPNPSGLAQIQHTLTSGYYALVVKSTTAGASAPQHVGQYDFNLAFPTAAVIASNPPDTGGPTTAGPQTCQQ